MPTNRARLTGIAAIVIVALGAIGLAATTGSTTDSVAPQTTTLSEGYDGAGDSYHDAMTSVEQAIGRTPSMAVAPMPLPPEKAGGGGPFPAATPMADAARNSVTTDSGALVKPGAPAGGPTDPLAYGADAGAADDRKIVQTASLRLQVKEVGAGFQEVGRIATGAGGFVASSSFSYQGDQQVASVTLRVPTSRYQDVLSDIRSLGSKVDTEASNSSDVTEEYTDLAARQRNLEATEQQLLTLLGQARNISEVLQVQDRLNNTRGEIERVKGRMNLLDKLTELSTITVHLRPVVAATNTGPTTGLGAAVRDAWQNSLDFLGAIATGVIAVLVFAWWVPILAVPAWLVLRRLIARPRPAAFVPPLEGA